MDVDLGGGAQNPSRRHTTGRRGFEAHPSKNEKQELSLFERSVTEVSERADELAKDGATLDGGEMAQMRATTVQQKREEVCAALQCAAGFHWMVEEWHDCGERKPRPEDKWVVVDIAWRGVRARAYTAV